MLVGLEKLIDQRSTSKCCSYVWGNLDTWRNKKEKKRKRKKGKKVVASCAEIEYQALTLDFFFPLMKTTFIDKMMKDTRASKKNQPHKRMEPH